MAGSSRTSVSACAPSGSARFRGVCVGLVAAVSTLCAHLGAGDMPLAMIASGPGLALLAAVCAVVGLIAARGALSFAAVLTAIVGAQFAGHLSLDLTHPGHDPLATLTTGMTAAHTAAAIAAAVLVVAGARVVEFLSNQLRQALSQPRGGVAAARIVAAEAAAPLRSALLDLLTPTRGPPVAA